MCFGISFQTPQQIPTPSLRLQPISACGALLQPCNLMQPVMLPGDVTFSQALLSLVCARRKNSGSSPCPGSDADARRQGAGCRGRLEQTVPQNLAAEHSIPCADATALWVSLPPITLIPPSNAGCRRQASWRPESASSSMYR